MTLHRKQPREDTSRTGTLITIYDAYTGTAQQVPGSVFNECFRQLEGVKVIKQTTPQFHKKTRILNANRYIGLEFDNEKVDIGENITIANFQFNINFYGMHKFCYLCQERHSAICPEKERFKEMEAARAGKITHQNLL